jgi:hypothetical protein
MLNALLHFADEPIYGLPTLVLASSCYLWKERFYE